MEAAIRLTLRVLWELEKTGDKRRTAIYTDACPSDECGARGKQENNCARNFSFFAHTLERQALHHLREHRGLKGAHVVVIHTR